MNTKEITDIKIPIKALVEQSMLKNDAQYEEDEFNLLRKFFIACLNLRLISSPKDLAEIIDKFTSKIKTISTELNLVNKLDCYKIVDSVLYIDGRLKFENSEFYEKNFYKAVTEVIFNSNDKHIGISNALTYTTAQKIYNMDTYDLRIVMPKTFTEKIGDDEINIRAGYDNYNLIISCLKQFFISKKINENKIIRKMFYEGYNKVLKDTINEQDTLFINIIDKLCLMYISRILELKTHPKEKELLDKYQIMVSETFAEASPSWFAFLALCTDDDLRIKCMKKFNMDI